MNGTGESGNETLELSRDEAKALAKRLIARHLQNDTDWLQWEDVPYLSERAFLLLDQEIDVAAKAIEGIARASDSCTDIDSVYLLEQAINGCHSGGSGL